MIINIHRSKLTIAMTIVANSDFWNRYGTIVIEFYVRARA